MVSKILVANRGEIAIRAFRAAYELGIATVAVFPYEDRNSEHRLKADEAYQIGEPGHPVRAYLDPGLIVEAAVKAGADAVYPGYGFLSENPALAEACAAAGITFIGPDAGVLTLTGNKASAIAAARAAGVPTLRSVAPGTDVDALAREARDLPFPVFVKAVAGGGGRGMRRVEEPGALRAAIETCMREAQAAFGNPTVFIEQAVIDPRHIEVQILADAEGGVIHLYERTARSSAATRRSSRSRPRRISTRACAAGSATTRCGSPPRSGTSTRARSSSWSTRRATTSSSR